MNISIKNHLKATFFCAILFLIGFNTLANNEECLAPPEVTTQLTEDYAIEMPRLRAYPIYVNAMAIDPDTMDRVELEIDGTTHIAEVGDGYYYYFWTPLDYGNHSIIITAIATSGEETILTRNLTVTDVVTTQTVGSLEDVVIEFGGTNSRWFYGTYTLPQFVGAYDSINATLNVECPNVAGGCDDWDRWAHIDVKAPDGNWIQIIRYITPYGVGCNHELDVTDYMSLLQGEVEFRVFIDTWGTGGWQLTLDLEYNQGTPEYPYTNVTEVWDEGYDFGNPANLQPVPTVNVSIPAEVQTSELRLSNTGHGWGQNNSGNAAEFFRAFHNIDIDGNTIFTQQLWNVCNPNPDGCTGQLGSWTFARAGWCPGAIAPPDMFDFAPYIGTSLDLDYIFHPAYMDACHANNPACVSGTTCPDCNDGFNPIYFVDAHIINKSHNPMAYGDVLGIDHIDNTKEYNVIVYPNPANGIFKIHTEYPESKTRLTINTIDGRVIKTFYFKTSTELNAFNFDLSYLAAGTYFINLENVHGTGTKKIILE